MFHLGYIGSGLFEPNWEWDFGDTIDYWLPLSVVFGIIFKTQHTNDFLVEPWTSFQACIQTWFHQAMLFWVGIQLDVDQLIAPGIDSVFRATRSGHVTSALWDRFVLRVSFNKSPIKFLVKKVTYGKKGIVFVQTRGL